MKYVHVTNRQQFNTGLQAIAASYTIAFDIETNGLNLWSDENTHMIGLAVYTDSDHTARYYPFRHGQGTLSDLTNGKRKAKKLAHTKQVYDEHVKPEIFNLPLSWLDEFHAVWMKPRLHQAHNALFDLAGLDKDHFPTPELIEDTMVTASLVNTDWSGNRAKGAMCYYPMPDTGKTELGNRGLKWLSRLFSIPNAATGEERLINALNTLSERLRGIDSDCVKLSQVKSFDKACLWMLDPENVAYYACLDVYMTYHLQHTFTDILQRWDMHDEQQLHRELVTRVAWPMQRNGFKLDISAAEKMSDYAVEEQQRIETDIQDITSKRVMNPGSTKQVLEYLQLEGHDVDNTRASTLKKLDTPVSNRVLKYRKAGKLSSYTDRWLDVHSEGYIHPGLNVFGTLSGRWSSSGYAGNFQNIPRVSGADNIQPKKVLLPPHDDLVLIEIDYSQLEIRVGAWIAEHIIGRGKDTTLTDIVMSGADMHNYTRDMCDVDRLILGNRSVPQWLHHNAINVPDDKTPQDVFNKIARHVAKTLNFLCMYGGGADAIRSQLSILDSSAADKLVNMWRDAYPAITHAMYYLQQKALQFRDESGNNEGVFQYLKYPMPGFQLVRKFNYYPDYKRSTMAKDGLNNVTQGTAGLLTVDAALQVFKRFGIASFTETDGNRVYDFSGGLIVPVITVHDSVIFALHPDHLHIVPEIKEIMTDYDISPLKLAVDVEASWAGLAWGYKKKVKNMDTWINSGGMMYE